MRWRRWLRAARRLLAWRAVSEFPFPPARSAEGRSLELLTRCLTREQRAEFERFRTFTVLGKSGQRYRITYGSTANVEVLTPDGDVMSRLCAGPPGLPIAAVMLAQKLMLESSEQEFIRIAAQGPGTIGPWHRLDAFRGAPERPPTF